MIIREANDSDWPHIWQILHRIIEQGDTFSCAPGTSEEEARSLWMNPTARVFVVDVDNQIVGCYYIKPVQPGLGSHIANAGYMVHPNCRGKGIGRALGQHSIQTARELGYCAMQFNFVISTNSSAVCLWQSLGFSIIGIIPEAYNHIELGYVDAYIMHRSL